MLLDFHIKTQFTFGTQDLERYPKFLDQIGEHQQASQVRKYIEKEISVFWRNHRANRSEQLKNFAFIRLTVNDSSPDKFKLLNNVPIKNSLQARNNWVNCDFKPRCQCKMFGDSAESLKRKNQDIPK